jgi:hypothetical protein
MVGIFECGKDHIPKSGLVPDAATTGSAAYRTAIKAARIVLERRSLGIRCLSDFGFTFRALCSAVIERLASTGGEKGLVEELLTAKRTTAAVAGVLAKFDPLLRSMSARASLIGRIVVHLGGLCSPARCLRFHSLGLKST